jgi:putative phosphoribosyl transferase
MGFFRGNAAGSSDAGIPRRPFEDRRDAGVALASHLRTRLVSNTDVVVLALPRGGVPVGYEVARALDAPLDVFLVRKLGAPRQPELAMGAIASGGVRVLHHEVVAGWAIPDSVIDAITQKELVEHGRRERTYREGRPPLDLHEKTAVLVDDGLATGSTMRAAVQAVRLHHPARVIIAVPVGAPDTCRELANVADEVVCAVAPAGFAAVGEWYRDFSQTTDEEVRALLHEAARPGRGW